MVLFAVTRLADAVSSGLAERRAESSGGHLAMHPTGFETRSARWWLQDLGFAMRAMRREPGFSVVVVSTLALGIGANTAVFSVLDVVLLQPLPVRSADRLVHVQTDNSPLKISGGPASYPDFVDWRAAESLRRRRHLSTRQLGHPHRRLLGARAVRRRVSLVVLDA